MIIEQIETFRIAVPLIKPFKTALRTVTIAESIFVKITCDNRISGWGEAPPTVVITGDTFQVLNRRSIIGIKHINVEGGGFNWIDGL